MACLGSIPSGDFNCTRTDYQGSMARVDEVIIIPTEDILSVSAGVPTLKPELRGTAIKGANNSLKCNIEMVKNEGGRDSVKATFEMIIPKVFALDIDTAENPGGMNLNCIIAFKTAADTYWCVGALGTLETLAVSQSSMDHGLRKYTIGTPDWKYGSSVVAITKAVYDGLK